MGEEVVEVVQGIYHSDLGRLITKLISRNSTRPNRVRKKIRGRNEVVMSQGRKKKTPRMKKKW